MALHSLSFKKKKKTVCGFISIKVTGPRCPTEADSSHSLSSAVVDPNWNWNRIFESPPTHTHRHTRCLEKTKQTCKITFLVSMDRYRLVSRWSSYTVTRRDMSCIHKVWNEEWGNYSLGGGCLLATCCSGSFSHPVSGGVLCQYVCARARVCGWLFYSCR